MCIQFTEAQKYKKEHSGKILTKTDGVRERRLTDKV